jgi:hypothetical protein
MLDRPTTPTPPADAASEDLSSVALAKEDPFDWAQTLLIRQVMRLEALSESALRMAQAIEGQVTQSRGLAEVVSATAGSVAAGPPPPALDAAAMSFSRVARGMHMTALLQSRLIGELEQARRREETRAEAEQDAGLEAERDKQRNDPARARKIRVEGIVARVATIRCGDDDQALDRLMTEAWDRLEDDDIYGDVMTRPVGELVAVICRDLGLEPDWPSLSQEAWAREEIESGAENSPFVNLQSARPPPFAAANGGGGPPADPGKMPGEEPGVVGAGRPAPPFNGSS